MNFSLKIGKLFRTTRGDISALLIIAFVFQLLTPIAVLANDSAFDSPFESSLRHSICRVEIPLEGDDSSAPSTAHTDGFVCDWCVLCSVGSAQVLERLPDVHFVTSSLAKSALAYGKPESLVLSLASRDKSSAPRGPPAEFGSASLSVGTFQTLATFMEGSAVKDI